MASTDFSQADLDALNDALAKGIKEVRYRDKTLVYRSLDEMLQLRALMRRCLNLDCKTGKKLISTNKGLGC